MKSIRYAVRVAQVWGYFISLGLRKRAPVVVVAAYLLIFGAPGLQNQPLDVIPEYAPLSLTVKTGSLGLSGAEPRSLKTDLLTGVPWLQAIPLSTINLTCTPGTDVLKVRQTVQEPMTLPKVSGPPITLEPVCFASPTMNGGLRSKPVSFINVFANACRDIAAQLRGGRELRKKASNDEKVVETAGEALCRSPVTCLNSPTPGTGASINTPTHRFNIPQHLIGVVGIFNQGAPTGTTARVSDVAHAREGQQLLIRDADFGDSPGPQKGYGNCPLAKATHCTGCRPCFAG